MCTTNAKVLRYILQGDPLCNLPSNLQGMLGLKYNLPGLWGCVIKRNAKLKTLNMLFMGLRVTYYPEHLAGGVLIT